MVDVRLLRDRIDYEIAKSGEIVIARVQQYYVDAEIEKRANLIVAGVNALREAESDLQKINRPDNPVYDGSGAVVGQYYTKGRLADLGKVKDRVAKLEQALNRVVVDGGLGPNADDFNKLEQVVKKGSGGKNDE